MFGRLFSHLFILLLRLISFLPYGILYLFADITFFFVYYVFKYRRAVVEANLQRSFPSKTEAERLDIEKKYYHFISDMIFECIKMVRLSPAEAMRRYKVENPELLEKYFSQGRSVLAVSGHYGNWEMASVFGFATDRPKFVIYKPLSNKIIGRFVNSVRMRFDATMIPAKNVVRLLAEFRSRPNLSLFLSDQIPAIPELNYFTLFLNQPTAFFVGTEKVAKMANTPVLLCDTKVLKRGHYSVEFKTLVEDVKGAAEFEITEAYVQNLEKMILRAPQYWLWSHRRWKYLPKDAKNPVFSQTLKAAGLDK